MLVEEFLRVGVDFDVKNRKMVDAQRIYHMMEPRNLSAAYKFYCGKTLTNAHSAEADTIATFEVLQGQIARYEGITVSIRHGVRKQNPIKNDVAALHELTASKMIDFAGRMVL
jgi:DNA polymerase-3 subunit epsilon